MTKHSRKEEEKKVLNPKLSYSANCKPLIMWTKIKNKDNIAERMQGKPNTKVVSVHYWLSKMALTARIKREG